jgi:hypothetical protein
MLKIIMLFFGTLFFLGGPSFSLGETVFSLEYHVVLTIGDSQYQARNTMDTADGEVVSIPLQDYRCDLTVSSYEQDKFLISIALFERIEGSWVQMDADPKGFGGRIGSFHTFDWNGDNEQLGIAMTVTRDN